MKILGIESSCDETSAAVLDNGALKSNIISSQFVHHQYGGVVPELASRAHQRLIIPVVEEALKKAAVSKEQLDAVAVTHGPGLIGALLVGVNFAKAFAYGLNIPLVGVNHLEAHLYSNFIDEPKPEFPFLCLVVSGGHTQLVLVYELFYHRLLGETLDDAAGEAYDKVAKMMGLGFPGGPLIDKLAKNGNPNFVQFPRSFLDDDSFDFSFSGIKTSVLYWLRKNNVTPSGETLITQNNELLSNLCASFQAAICDVLVGKMMRAVEQCNVRNVAVAGGVSANSELRRRLQRLASEKNIRVFIPKPEYCTDNGAMIATVGWMKLKNGITSDLELNATASLSL